MTTETLSPQSLRERLVIVPTPDDKILKQAETENKNVIAYWKNTPFGSFLMALEIEQK